MGVTDIFMDNTDELCYAGLYMKPIMYQDDVARLATSLSSVQSGNTRMESMAESKLLDFNLQKLGFISIGSHSARKAIDDELLERPVTLCGQVMKKFQEAKYLGDWISEKGLSESVACTVKKRKGFAIASIHEIRSVIDDCRSNLCGGIQVGLDIWEIGVIPMLLDRYIQQNLGRIRRNQETLR